MKLIVILFIALTGLFPRQEVPMQLDEATRKKLDKLVMQTFNIEKFSLRPLFSPGDSTFAYLADPNSGDYYQILFDGRLKGMLYLGTAKGRYDRFDFMIIYNTELIIEKVEVLVYREDHGFEIMNKRWLDQFKGTDGCELEYGRDIDAISGATLSARSLTNAIKEACNQHQK